MFLISLSKILNSLFTLKSSLYILSTLSKLKKYTSPLFLHDLFILPINCSSLSSFEISLYPISISISTPASITWVAIKITPFSSHSLLDIALIILSIELSSPVMRSILIFKSSSLSLLKKSYALCFFINSINIFLFLLEFFKTCSYNDSNGASEYIKS